MVSVSHSPTLVLAPPRDDVVFIRGLQKCNPRCCGCHLGRSKAWHSGGRESRERRKGDALSLPGLQKCNPRCCCCHLGRSKAWHSGVGRVDRVERVERASYHRYPKLLPLLCTLISSPSPLPNIKTPLNRLKMGITAKKHPKALTTTTLFPI